MSHARRMSVVLALALVVVSVRSARADEYDELMTITFSGPVEVPGVVLPAGTYLFRLGNPDTERNVVEILSEDHSQLYATLLTVPADRATVTYKPVVTFEERSDGSPDAIRAIFYPGRTGGKRFVYPADQKDDSRVADSTKP